MGQIVCLDGAWPSLPSFALPFLRGLSIGQLHLWAWGPLSAQPTTHHPVASSIFFFFIYFIYLFLAVLGLHCCAWTFSSCGERGLLFVEEHGLLRVVASLVAELRF